MPLRAGARVGAYEIRGPLGSGGMGEVFLAWDGRLSREVAVKILPDSAAENPDRLRRFEQEAKAAGVLNHAAHQRGIVHRDLKPENVFVARDGHVKILVAGKREPWKELTPSDPAGVRAIGTVHLTPDGRSYVYAFYAALGGLYPTEGLR